MSKPWPACSDCGQTTLPTSLITLKTDLGKRYHKRLCQVCFDKRGVLILKCKRASRPARAEDGDSPYQQTALRMWEDQGEAT